MKKTILAGLFCAAAATAQAATLTVVMDNDSSGFVANPAILTLNFGNSTENATSFGAGDFVSRSWQNLDELLPSNAPDYPTSNFQGTIISIAGTVSNAGHFSSSFRYTEQLPGANFSSIDLTWVTITRLRGPALIDAQNGATPNFYVRSVSYNETGTAADFGSTAAVPLPAGVMLLGTALLGLGAARRGARRL